MYEGMDRRRETKRLGCFKVVTLHTNDENCAAAARSTVMEVLTCGTLEERSLTWKDRSRDTWEIRKIHDEKMEPSPKELEYTDMQYEQLSTFIVISSSSWIFSEIKADGFPVAQISQDVARFASASQTLCLRCLCVCLRVSYDLS